MRPPVLDGLASRGISLQVRGERLLYQAPKGVLTPDLLAELRRLKPDLIEYANHRHHRVVDLRQRVELADDWNTLDILVDTAQAARDDGELTDDELDSIATQIADRSRYLPENAGEISDVQPLSAFLAERHIAQVNSRILGQDVLFAADVAEIPLDNDLVVYCEAELRELVGKTPEQLRKIHEVKKAIDGEVVDTDDCSLTKRQ